MECTCGITYPDTRLLWKYITITVPHPLFDEDHHCLLFYAVCPECSEIGIKLNTGPRWADDYDPDPFTENVKGANRIHPVSKTPERKEIDLDGVPEGHCGDYRKALIALDHPDLYEFANIVARRSLESILREKYKGRTLSDLIDELQKDGGNGLSRGLLGNIDAIRNLGNMGAHEVLDNDDGLLRADKEQTAWNITVWERFLDEWYVRPAQDVANLTRLKQAGLNVKEP